MGYYSTAGCDGSSVLNNPVCCLAKPDCEWKEKQEGMLQVLSLFSVVITGFLSTGTVPLSFFCLTVAKLWPEGSFGLPQTVYGCPVQEEFPWLPGQVTLTFDASTSISHSPSFDLAGKLGKNFWSLKLCSKVDHSIANEYYAKQMKWPDGTYCIFAIDKRCPAGQLACIPVWCLSFW